MTDYTVRLLNALQRKPLTNQEKAANCLKLADILDNVEERAFDMANWVHKTECGTTACALGHAVLSGMIPGVEVVVRTYQSSTYKEWTPRMEVSKDFVLWEAVGEAFFGLEACEEIFYDTCPREACCVADELREEAARLLSCQPDLFKENNDE